MTVLTAIKYDRGVIVGADRLVCFSNGQREDKSKLVIRKNFVVALTGRTTKQINVFERHNRFWSKLDDYIDTQNSYSESLETISDFLTSINLGLKQSEFARHISSMASNKQIRSFNLQMSFMYALRYDNSISLYFDGAIESNSQIRCKRSILTTPGEINFQKEYTRSKNFAYQKVLQRIRTANDAYPDFCSGVEIVDFTPKKSELLYLEHIH